MRKTNPNFLNGVPELLILRLLARREMYGYELVKNIQTGSNEAFKFGEGCVYPILHHLEKSRFVTSERLEVGGRARTYYRLSPTGRRRLEALTAEWREVGAGVASVLGVENA